MTDDLDRVVWVDDFAFVVLTDGNIVLVKPGDTILCGVENDDGMSPIVGHEPRPLH